MADKCADSLQREIGRELCLVRGKSGRNLGYTKGILIENLSERESTIFVCIRCQGLMREVCTSSGGEQFCSSCKKGDEQTHPNIQMDNMILSFKSSCPLIVRGCKWLGVLGGCQNHLDTCGYVYETCKLRCGVVLQRNKLRIHVTDTCIQRLIQCEHCKGDFEFCDMSAHLDVCPKMEVSCELKCGVVMCREVMTQHLEVDCPEKAIECPYAKYKCVGLIKRKYMSKHLEERRVEHLELKLKDIIMETSKESEIIAKQKEKISEQSATIELMSQEIKSLEKGLENLTDFTVSGILNSNPIKLEWITKLPERYCHIKKQFLIAGYQFEFDFYRYYCFNPLSIIICPQNGFYYENLKWPFKAEFRTRLRSKRNPTVTKEFKSEVIVVERKDFNSDSKKYFNIVTISNIEYRNIESNFLTDDVVEFEIFVIFV